MDREKLFHKILEILEKEIQILSEGSKTALKESKEAPGAMQSHSDTTKFEMKRMEENINKRIGEKKKLIEDIKGILNHEENFSEIKQGSVIEIEKEGEKKFYIYLKSGGGIKINEGGNEFIVVSDESPLGKILFGKKRGDEFEFNGKKMNILNLY